MDLPDAEKAATLFQQALGIRKVLRISAATGRGIKPLLMEIQRAMDRDDECQTN